MPRLPHGKTITLDDFLTARDTLADRSADITLGFAAARPVVTQDFGFLFPELQQDPDNLLPEGRATRDALVDLGRVMLDDDASSEDADIPAAYTYSGQFVDHDITLDAESAELPDLLDPDLAPAGPDRRGHTERPHRDPGVGQRLRLPGAADRAEDAAREGHRDWSSLWPPTASGTAWCGPNTTST